MIACLVIAGATVHTETGPEKGVTVVAEGDRIVAVGRGLKDLKLELDLEQQVRSATWQGRDCTFVQGGGKQLTPGLVAVPTTLGLVEVGLERGSRDDDPHTSDPIRAALRVADAYDPRSSLIPVTRIEGVTSALVAPGGGFVAGQAAWVQLRGATQAEAVRDGSVAMIAGLPTSSRAEGLRQVRELVADLRAWARDPSPWDRGRPFPEGASRLDLDALVPVARGELPLVVGADDAADLEALIRLKGELGLDLVVTGAAEGWLMAEALAEADIPVIVDPLLYGPSGFDQLHARKDNAARLAEAGVDVILSTFSTHNARTLRQVAGNAAREGMPRDAALKAITRTPAQVFGQDDVGRIAPGARADLVLWTGDPLEVTTWVERLWIGGVEVDKRSRQTELTEKYLTLPATPAPTLTLP